MQLQATGSKEDMWSIYIRSSAERDDEGHRLRFSEVWPTHTHNKAHKSLAMLARTLLRCVDPHTPLAQC